MKWSDLTTPPRPQRTPAKKYPLFTTKFQSTKSFSPGHLVGAGILVLGVAGITKLFVDRAKAESDRVRQGGGGGAKLAEAGNARGEYEKRR